MATLFVDQLTVIDCSVLDPNAGLIGESYIVDVELSGALDDQGMVLDFSAVKRQLKRSIDALVDHRLLLPLRHPGLLLSETTEQIRIRFTDNHGHCWEHESPAVAVCGLAVSEVTPDSLAFWLAPRLLADLPAGLQLRIELRHEQIDGAYYRYSHGLQRHNGACQRIAHGHRSRLQVSIGGVRRPDIELQWANRFKDIYIASHGHFVREFEQDGHKYVELRYQAIEGDYRLILPQERCYWLSCESTVEQIAAHLAEQIQFLNAASESTIQVRAFEGVQKGALACA